MSYCNCDVTVTITLQKHYLSTHHNSPLRRTPCNCITKQALAQVFSCGFCELSKNTYSYRTPLAAAFLNSVSSFLYLVSSYLSSVNLYIFNQLNVFNLILYVLSLIFYVFSLILCIFSHLLNIYSVTYVLCVTLRHWLKSVLKKSETCDTE